LATHDLSSFDLIAIGSGPAGQRAAIQAAKLGKRVALIERETALGGVCTNTGTIPSKTLRAAIVELTGRGSSVYGSAIRVQHEITIDDLLWRTQQVVERDREMVADELRRHHVHVVEGAASFQDEHTVLVRTRELAHTLRGERIVVAVGTTPVRPEEVEFDGKTVLDSDELLQLHRIPKSMAVVGGGIVGLEYASMLAALGVRVTLVDKRARMLEFVDDDLVEALLYHLRGLGLAFRLGEEAESVVRAGDAGAVVHLRGGKQLRADAVLYTAGRQGATAALNLEAAGLAADERGCIAVDGELRTAQPHIFAAGDVVGSPRLAATSMEQGRLAALFAFGEEPQAARAPVPYGFSTIPEISYTGQSERELAAAAVPYVVGLASYRELPRGDIAGDRTGLLKLLVHAETRAVLGVHIFGTGAMELVHTGQAVIAGDLPVDYLADAVFNVPTFSDAYRVAALDAAGRLAELGRRPSSAAA
jgi:NAD(P) transhydrogenase